MILVYYCDYYCYLMLVVVPFFIHFLFSFVVLLLFRFIRFAWLILMYSYMCFCTNTLKNCQKKINDYVLYSFVGKGKLCSEFVVNTRKISNEAKNLQTNKLQKKARRNELDEKSHWFFFQNVFPCESCLWKIVCYALYTSQNVCKCNFRFVQRVTIWLCLKYTFGIWI